MQTGDNAFSAKYLAPAHHPDIPAVLKAVFGQLPRFFIRLSRLTFIMTMPSWAWAWGINTTHLETQYLSYQRLTPNLGFWLLDSTLIENPVVLVTASTHLLALLHQHCPNTNGFSLLKPLCNQFQSKDSGQSPSEGGHIKPANELWDHMRGKNHWSPECPCCLCSVALSVRMP